MSQADLFTVEVAYAKPDVQVILPVQVSAGATALDAICQSGIATRFPEIEPEKAEVGIFGHAVKLNKPLRAGDRVEIYRPLLCDPKEVRRRRAKK